MNPHSPPGWPLLLSPLVALFPGNFAVLKLFSLVLWLASIPLAHRLFAPYIKSPYLELLTAVIALNPHLIGISGTVMSEAAFLFFSLLCLNLLAEWHKGTSWRQNELMLWIVVTAVTTLLIRTIGVALVAGVVAFLLYRYKSRLLWGLGALAMLLLLGSGRFIFSDLYNQHFAYVASQLGQFLRFWEYAPNFSYEIVANAVVPVFELGVTAQILTAAGARIAALLIVGLVIGGWALSWRRQQPFAFYTLFYMGILYFWFAYINEVQPRQLIPIIPFLTFYLWQSIMWLAGRVAKRPNQAHQLALVGMSLVFIAGLTLNVHRWQVPERERVIDLTAGSDWIRHNTPQDAIIMTEDAIPAYLYMHRQTVEYQPYDEMNDYLAQYDVAYLVIRPSLEWWDRPYNFLNNDAEANIVPYVTDHPHQFELVYSNSNHNITIYEVRHDS